MTTPLRDAVETVAAELTANGCPTTADPSQARAGLGTILPTALAFDSLDRETFTLSADLYLLGNPRHSQVVVMDALWSALDVVRRVYDADEANAVTFDLANGTSLPGLVVPLTLQVDKD